MPLNKNIMRIFGNSGKKEEFVLGFDPSKLVYKDGLTGIKDITIEGV
jgi:hypothetical protein